MAYAQSRKDFEYLEKIEPLDDWVEIQGDMEALMQEPTKQKAEEYYLSCIGLWFGESRISDRQLTRRAKTIKERYGF